MFMDKKFGLILTQFYKINLYKNVILIYKYMIKLYVVWSGILNTSFEFRIEHLKRVNK